jgi:hypothetical protein
MATNFATWLLFIFSVYSYFDSEECKKYYNKNKSYNYWFHNFLIFCSQDKNRTCIVTSLIHVRLGGLLNSWYHYWRQFRHLTISTRPLLGGLVSQITGQRYWGESLHYSKVRGSAKHTVVRRGIEPHQGNLLLGFGTNPHYAYLTMLGGLMSGFPHLFLLCINLLAK